MEALFNKILELQKDNKVYAVATIVSSRGSSPRKVASKMLVLADGCIEGTIGGGSLEKQVIIDSLAAIKRKRPALKDYKLNKACGLSVCGGKVSIFIDVISPQKRLVVCGGGHIGLALSLIAKILGFSVMILDNRRSFANKKRFPHVDEIVCAPYRQSLKKNSFDKNTHIVIVTHGHLYDTECLEAALKTDAGYIGMIGSRIKIKSVFGVLKKKGIKKSRLNEVFTPIGLDIGAKTPEEISVAIAAELVKVSNKEV